MAKILVADDDKEIRNLLNEMLSIDGHHVVTASDGENALNFFCNDNFDLVITDIVMPNKDGIDFIMGMLNSHKDTPIIAMSGGRRIAEYNQESLVSLSNEISNFNLDSAQQLGIDGILKKPFSVIELFSMVNRVLTVI